MDQFEDKMVGFMSESSDKNESFTGILDMSIVKLSGRSNKRSRYFFERNICSQSSSATIHSSQICDPKSKRQKGRPSKNQK